MICASKVGHFRRCIFFVAKKGQKQKRHSAEFKLSVIMDIKENSLIFNFV